MEAPAVTPDGIVKLGLAFRAAKALLSAVELGVFTSLAEGPLDLDMLRKRVGIDERGARDFFDALVALGMLERDEGGRYANTPETALYLDRQKPTYIGGELDHFNTYVYPHWNSLTPALRTGKPQSGARAIGHYPALYSDPAALEALPPAFRECRHRCLARRVLACWLPGGLRASGPPLGHMPT
jgi:Dimerisation domain